MVAPPLCWSGHFLLLGLVLGAAGTGIPLQPVAQHAELGGRCSPAAARQFWGTGAAPQLCVLLGALLTAAAKRKYGCISNSALLFLWPLPLLSILPLCPSHRPGGALVPGLCLSVSGLPSWCCPGACPLRLGGAAWKPGSRAFRWTG